MTHDTQLLANNPIIKDISIIVAKQLMQKSRDDPRAMEKLLTKDQREQLSLLQAQLDREQ
jgi:hypothetical protein